jgi:hypothetical protein
MLKGVLPLVSLSYRMDSIPAVIPGSGMRPGSKKRLSGGFSAQIAAKEVRPFHSRYSRMTLVFLAAEAPPQLSMAK